MEKEKRIGFSINNISRKLKKNLDEEMEQFGITGVQGHILGTILFNGGTVTQKKLERELNKAHATIVEVVNRMADNNLITIKVDEKDRRNRLIGLTDKSKEIHEIILRKLDDSEQKLLDLFNEEEQELLIGFLKRIDQYVSGSKEEENA